MRYRFLHFLPTLLFCVTGTLWGLRPASAAPSSGGGAPFRTYFKEQRPLAERPGELAIFAEEGDAQASLVRGLESRGVHLRSMKEHPIKGWLMAEAEATSGQATMRDLVSAASAGLPTRFVTPVFRDDYGEPLFPTPQILIRFEDGVPEARAEEILQQSGSAGIVERNWGKAKGSYRIQSGGKTGYDVLDLANRLAALPEVRYAEPDMVFTGRSSLIPNDPGFPDSWALQNTGQSGGVVDEDMDIPEAWDFQTGSVNVAVLVLDTGVQQDHPDIHQSPGFDATGENGGGGPVNACDRHGTAVAGCISGIINNNLGTAGTAPGCRVISARFAISNAACDGSWTAQFSWTVNCLTYGENNFIRITNNSNYYGAASSAITDKYNSTYTGAGMIHFAAAGNNTASAPTYPASIPLVNSVAALNRTGVRASFSNYGTGLDFSAPGEAIYSTDRTGTAGYGSGDYVFVDGTSFASPLTAGVAALMLSVNPGLANFTLEDYLRQSCVDKGAPGYDTDYGWGAINARSALERVAGCSYSLSETARSVPSAGGVFSFSVMVAAACPWTVVSNDGWIVITSPSPVKGNGIVNYSVASNSGTTRIGHITVAGQSYTVTQASVPPPSNDAFSAAIPISGAAGTVTGSNVGATKEPGEPNHGGNFGGASAWWNWTAPASGPVVFTTDGSSFDTLLGVYLGRSVSALTFVAGDDDSGEGPRSRVAFNATRGAVYRIAVDGANGAVGAITLSWNQSPIPATYQGTNQSLSVISISPGFQVLYYDYNTGDLSVSPYQPASAKTPYIQPPAEWIGLFLYDYGTQRFSQAVYRTNQGI